MHQLLPDSCLCYWCPVPPLHPQIRQQTNEVFLHVRAADSVNEKLRNWCICLGLPKNSNFLDQLEGMATPWPTKVVEALLENDAFDI